VGGGVELRGDGRIERELKDIEMKFFSETTWRV
jgi:hypothetical protein